MLKKVLSLAILAGLALNATSALAVHNSLNGYECNATEKAANKMYYSEHPNAGTVCCAERLAAGSNKFIGNIIGGQGYATECPVDADHIKLSGPNYCPCEFTKG